MSVFRSQKLGGATFHLSLSSCSSCRFQRCGSRSTALSARKLPGLGNLNCCLWVTCIPGRAKSPGHLVQWWRLGLGLIPIIFSPWREASARRREV